MANFLSVCHKSLSENQINEVVQIYNDRLLNDMTRDASLKALAKITSNGQQIQITNLAILIPRMFDLLHKAMRTIHLNTLEAMVAMIQRYPQQFQAKANDIVKELWGFVKDEDMQASALALRVAIPSIQITNPASPEVQEFITRAAILTKSPLIQGQQMLVRELLDFFQAAAQVGAVQQKTLAELFGYVSIGTQAAAKAYARAAFFNKDGSKKNTIINDMNGMIAQ